MSVWLATSMFSEVLNGACEHWPVEAIPPGVLVWLSRYASNLPRSDSYESKLYLRLRGQLPRRINPKTTTRLMIPLCLPARITKPARGECALPATALKLVIAGAGCVFTSSMEFTSGLKHCAGSGDCRRCSDGPAQHRNRAFDLVSPVSLSPRVPGFALCRPHYRGAGSNS